MYTLRKPTIIAVALGLALALLFGALAMFGGKPASADAIGSEPGPDVNPTFVDGNKTCQQLGYAYELKVDPVPAGTYSRTSDDGFLTVNITTTDQTYFDWTSNVGVDAVIAKGGPDENAYVYDPPAESKGDDGLHAPDVSSGEPAQLSHISFCYDIELQVSKTADTSYTKTYDWTIDKSVTPATWNLFKGDSGTSDYTVSVNKDEGTDSDWKVTGKITIKNPDPSNAATITEVKDVVTQGATDTTATVNNCTSMTVAANGTVTCDYSADLPNGTNGTNKATVKTAADSKVKGGSGTADVDFSKATVNKVNDSITVNDSYAGAGSPWTFSDDGSKKYSRKFTCGESQTVENTAAIQGLNKSDSASVKVNCYDLDVSKDASTSYTKTYKWTIDKSADKSKVTLEIGQSSPVKYSVKVDQTSQNSDFAVKGKITVSNPAPIPAEINSVSDIVSPDIDAQVDCGQSFPITLPKEDSLTCSYSASLPDDKERTNTATASLQNYDYDSSGGKKANGTTDFSGTALVDFTNASVKILDGSIDVTDSLKGFLGTVAAANAPKTFEYTRNVGPYENCGTFDVPNTASFVTNDTKAKGESSWKVDITVLCKAKVVKTVSGAVPSGTQAFTFQLRQGATTTANGTILESKVANAANGGVINFATGLEPGSTYQLCEIVMPGWSTSLGTFVPGSFMPPDGVAANPNVDNSILCINFTPKAGETATFEVNNTPPPGGRALTIGFWKNWASCSGGGQKPVLDQTLAKAEPVGIVISATSGMYAPFGGTYWLVLHGSTAKPNSAPDCLKAVRLLNKSTIDKGTKKASDPAFNLAAQLLAAQLNYTAGAGKTPAATSAINQAVLLLGKYKFDGKTHTSISAADATTMNNLARTLDDYNNNR